MQVKLPVCLLLITITTIVLRDWMRFWDENVAVTTRVCSLHTCLLLSGFVSHSICETAAISQSGEWVCEEGNRWGSLLMKKLHTLTHTLSLSPFNKTHCCIATNSLIIMIRPALVLKCFGERNTTLHDPMRNMAAALSQRWSGHR